MREELSAFLGRSLHDPAAGWPRLPRRTSAPPEATRSGPATGLRVLVVGTLIQEFPVAVAATRAQVADSLLSRCEGPVTHWRLSEPRLAGFVAHAVPAAASLGARVSVRTMIPVPIPARFVEFFGAHGVDWRHVQAVPAQCPVVIRVRCSDGELVFRRPGILSGGDPGVPPTVERQFDVILLDSDSCGTMCTLVGPRRRRHEPGATCLGMRANSRWKRHDFRLARQPEVWTFLRGADARERLRRMGQTSRAVSETTLAQYMRHRFAVGRLVLHGSEGAVLANRETEPSQVRAQPIVRKNLHGAGDVLLSVTTLSSAAGADDRTSLRRGVAAATAHCAGLPLPGGDGRATPRRRRANPRPAPGVCF